MARKSRKTVRISPQLRRGCGVPGACIKTALVPKGPEPLNNHMERATGSPRICFANPCFAAGLRPLRAALENAHAFSQLRTLPGSIPVARHANENGSGPHKEPKPLKLSFGAGDGNRTRVISLEGWGSTIELRPQDMVGTTGFEPATSCSQSRRATKLRHVPKVLSS